MKNARVFIWGAPGQYGAYAAAIRQAGGIPVLSRDLQMAEHCSALVLPGGGDVDPGLYGQANTASRDLEPERDRAEIALLSCFTSSDRPVLGICRGLQMVNVFFGGDLVQDLPGHCQWRGLDRLHCLRCSVSPLRELWGDSPVVNSAHHQAAGRIGCGLRVVQWTSDGIPEALLHRSAPIWAVQYHPERMAGPSLSARGAADGGQLFRAWLALCR